MKAISKAVKAAIGFMQEAVRAQTAADKSAGSAFDLCRKSIAAYADSGEIPASIKGKARLAALRDWAEGIEGVKITLSDYVAKITAAYAVPTVSAVIETKGKEPSRRTVTLADAKSKGDFAALAKVARAKLGTNRNVTDARKKKAAEEKAELERQQKEAVDKAVEKAVKTATGDGTSFYRTVQAILTAGSDVAYLRPTLIDALESCGFKLVTLTHDDAPKADMPKDTPKAPRTRRNGRANSNVLMPPTPQTTIAQAMTTAMQAKGNTPTVKPRRVNGKAQSASQ